MTDIQQRGRYGRYLQWIFRFIDFLLLNAAFFATAALTPEFIAPRPRAIWMLANLSYILAIVIIGRTRTVRYITIDNVFAAAIKTVCIMAPAFFIGVRFIQVTIVPWYAYAEFFAMLFVIFPLWWIMSRQIIKRFRRRGRNFSTVVIIGANATSRRLYDVLTSDVGFGYRVIGVFDSNEDADTTMPEFRGGLDKLEEFAATHVINEIFCTLPGNDEEGISRSLKFAESNVIQFYYVPYLSSNLGRTFDLYALDTMPVLSVRHQPLSHLSNRILKRAFDIAFSSIVLLFSPLVFIPVAIAIKVSSPGPVFFRQKRTGYRGRDFYCYKFRSMRVNAEADTTQATKNDPRKTRLGNFLRHSSIDELPQFINVFLGDMSVVGPRPHMLSHTEQYRKIVDKYMVRHFVKPGITGWAQINGYRGQTEELWQMEKRVEADVWYIEHWNMALDIRIIVSTVVNAIQGEKNAF